MCCSGQAYKTSVGECSGLQLSPGPGKQGCGKGNFGQDCVFSCLWLSEEAPPRSVGVVWRITLFLEQMGMIGSPLLLKEQGDLRAEPALLLSLPSVLILILLVSLCLHGKYE